MNVPASPPIDSANAACAEFQTTHWSVVLAAGDGASARANDALEILCRTYWYPLYAFARRSGHDADEAQDLTQSFFARFLERKDFARARREKGRLRSFLLVSLKHFLINEAERSRTQKRGGACSFVPLDTCGEERFALEPTHEFSAEKSYERRWALTLLDQVFHQLQKEYLAAGNAPLFEALKVFLTGADSPSQAALAAQLGMNENALKQALFRMRQRYRTLLRGEIANTVATPAEVEDELRYLIAILRE
jgi:DNA-directed RNA polymerase specialized sigma24 family protein